MTAPVALAIFASGVVAGTVNTIVGSGTLITFPVLIGFGINPVVANVSNTIGLVPGSFSGAFGYRRELAGQRSHAMRLGVVSACGGITGAVLLLALPAAAFKTVVPAFIALALMVVIFQPWLELTVPAWQQRSARHEPWLLGSLFAIGVYGGYFGAAQGILLLAVLSVALGESLQRVNGLKNVLAMLTNLAAGIVFATAAHVDWLVVLLIACGSTIGGQLGARVGRRLPSVALRALIVLVGVSAIVRLVA
jgi:hypothetical protein